NVWLDNTGTMPCVFVPLCPCVAYAYLRGAYSVAERVTHKIFEFIIRSGLRSPIRLQAEHRVRVAEHQAQKHFGDTTSADWSQLRGFEGFVFVDREFDRLHVMHCFSENISPQRTLPLEFSVRNIGDGRLWKTALESLPDTDVRILEHGYLHRFCDLLT